MLLETHKLRAITSDRGKEFVKHRLVSEAVGGEFYFPEATKYKQEERKLSCFITYNPLIKYKTRLLHLVEELGNISQVCKEMGMSQDIFYRYQQA